MEIAVNTSLVEGGLPKTKSSYLEAIKQAGYKPRVINPSQPVELLKRVQALILIGGPDIPTEFYGGRSHPTIKQQSPAKIDHDFRMIHFCLKHDIPVLGICAGMQTLGCFFKGTLFPHIPEAGSSQEHQIEGRHLICSVSKKLDRLFRVPTRSVNSRHHQCIESPGLLQVDAMSEDGFIEAVSHPSKPILGVQWHPEDLIKEKGYFNLFRSLGRNFR